MNWVLIIIMGGSHAGIALKTEFNSQELCEKAKKELDKSEFASYHVVKCFETGNK